MTNANPAAPVRNSTSSGVKGGSVVLAIDSSPSARSQHRLLSFGRGINLMKIPMDEARFEQGGTVVYMRKNSNSHAEDTGKAGG